MIRVVIAVGVGLYGEALAQLLQARAKIEVASVASDIDEAVSAVIELAPDVALVDATMRPEGVRRILEVEPRVRVIALGIEAVEREVVAWAEAGVNGYVMCNASSADVHVAVESVMREEVICSPRTTAILLRRVATLASERLSNPTVLRLTTREREVACLLEQGLSNKAIAQHLHIEVATVKNHVHSILEKLDVHRRAEAASRLRTQPLRPRSPENYARLTGGSGS